MTFHGARATHTKLHWKPGASASREARGRRQRSSLAALLTAAALVVASAGAAGEPAPAGYGKARFRMSVEEVRALYPEGEVIRTSSPENALQTSRMPEFVVVALKGETVLGMSGCSVRLQFASDRLYVAHVNCGSDPTVREVLEKTYGEPAIIGGTPYWLEEQYGISLNPHSMVFGYFDIELERLVQGAVLQAVVEEATAAAAEQ